MGTSNILPNRSPMKERYESEVIHRSFNRNDHNSELTKSRGPMKEFESPPYLKNVLKAANNISRPVMQYSTVDMNYVKKLAAKLFEIYNANTNTGSIDGYQAKSMIQDSHLMLGKSYFPNDSEGRSFISIHDKDRDGRLTLKDLENIMISYLCTSNANSNGFCNLSTDSPNKGVTKSSFSRRSQLPTLQERIVERVYSPQKPSPTRSYEPSPFKNLYRRLSTQLGENAVDEELRHALAIFSKYDLNKNGYLEAYEVRPMMKDTYEYLGQKINPSSDQISNYIAMMDVANDKRISLKEYQMFILRALEKRNIYL